MTNTFRRAISSVVLAACGALSASAEPTKGTRPAWTFERYSDLVRATERNMNMSREAFDAVQARKPIAIAQTKRYLASRFGEADSAVIAAFECVPREYFHYNYERKQSSAEDAYETFGTPWPIGFGATISEYKLQCYMTQLGRPKPTDVVLEIGAGSGFQAALFSEIVKEVYTIEIVEPLGNAVREVLKKGGYDNVRVSVGDGFYGWPEVKGGFDIIMVTCAARYVPPALIQQLKVGGRLIIPVGPPGRGGQVLYLYEKDAQGKVRSMRDLSVIFVPMTGAIDKQRETAHVE
ncbi:MAG: protein-L-isoaspartate O-methyltransferase [Candidatus Hydrogenedentes bacterium]|nr:protein-L-isoaspartate O-methyltransferase [Candidatus Hydrogenedentota bacterium]